MNGTTAKAEILDFLDEASGFHAEILDQASEGNALARMRAIATAVRLPASHRWMTEGCWYPAAADALMLCLRAPTLPDFRQKVGIEPIQTRAEAECIRDDLRSQAVPDWDNCGVAAAMNELLARQDLAPGSVWLSARSLERRNRAEGMLSACREIWVDQRGDAQVLKYAIDLKFIYVAPDARGSRIALHLVAALVRQILGDLADLKDALDRLPHRPQFVIGVFAEPETDAGRRLASTVARAMEGLARAKFGLHVEFEHVL